MPHLKFGEVLTPELSTYAKLIAQNLVHHIILYLCIKNGKV
jgi:hypothetical protein